MIRILGTIFAGLLGLAFGSFLNVCLSRWPTGESVVSPRSHCRNCDHTLAWWENIPLVSWLFLRGRCRNCHTAIGWRYPLVELTVGALWAIDTWNSFFPLSLLDSSVLAAPAILVCFIGPYILLWLLTALAVLDAENFWLPDRLTFPGIVCGMIVFTIRTFFFDYTNVRPVTLANFFTYMWPFWRDRIMEVLAAASLILLIRWLYKLIRHQEGLGLGDAKLMAMLAAWLGLPGALLAFALGSILGAIAAIALLAIPSARTNPQSWATSKLPLGTFLCIGGVVSSLWGQPIINAYLRIVGF